ncbi:MAG: hypothetical protein LKG19_14780 [Saprospiraceae bacterium]|jgi:hypothetical protein|nr:hypothetical protein [Saprospiraceae bacterium]
MTNEAELKFLDKIDCKFPYQDRYNCIKLIKEAASLSSNSTFAVIEELCRIPVSEKRKVKSEYLLDLLAQTSKEFDHPLKEMILNVASQMIQGKTLPVEEVISKMEIVKEYHGQFCALNILYFSCDDINGKMEPLNENIRAKWNK